MVSELYIALDYPELEKAVRAAQDLAAEVDGFKVGLEMFWGYGPEAVRRITDLGRPVFVDAKLHDIPNTVAGAARSIGRLGARYVTVHASGGGPMIEAAATAVRGTGTGVLAVTTLTSLDQGGRRSVGLNGDLKEHVVSLARLASECGAEGIVCAVDEARAVKDNLPQMTVVTPGIRLEGQDGGDQARIATPRKAVEAGADLLVVGRSVTGADDPVGVARQIASASLRG